MAVGKTGGYNHVRETVYEGGRTGRKLDRRGCRMGKTKEKGVYDRNDAGQVNERQKECRPGGNRTGIMQDLVYPGQERCRAGMMQDRRNAGMMQD